MAPYCAPWEVPLHRARPEDAPGARRLAGGSDLPVVSRSLVLLRAIRARSDVVSNVTA